MSDATSSDKKSVDPNYLPIVPEEIKEPNISFWYVYFLGIGIKLGGFAINWNYAFLAGFERFYFSVIGIGIAYTMLALCMAEMVSIMSFSGGYYGYARCAVGPLYGFLVGCSGAMESIFYLALLVLKIGKFTRNYFRFTANDEPLIWFVVYSFLILFHLVFSKHFWNMTFIISVCSFILIMIYILGSIPYLDFERYANHNPGDASSFGDVFAIFRWATLFFLGFDMVTLTSNEVKDAKRTIPYVLLSLVGTLFVLALVIVLVVASQAPGVSYDLYKTTSYFPLAYGYEKMFKLNYKQATFIGVIPAIISAIGYLHIVARQFKSMSTSGLLPPIFKVTYGSENNPVYAMFLVVILAYLANVYGWAEGARTVTHRISTMAGCFVYVSMFYCFILFRSKFGNLERAFRNPLGIWSAVIGMLFFAVTFFIILCYQFMLFWTVSVVYFSYIFLMLIYYYAYAESRQCFSASEQKVFFKAYIVNMQIRKKKALHHRFATDLTSLLTFGLCSKSNSKIGYYQSNSDQSHEVISSDKAQKKYPKKTTNESLNIVQQSNKVNHSIELFHSSLTTDCNQQIESHLEKASINPSTDTKEYYSIEENSTKDHCENILPEEKNDRLLPECPSYDQTIFI